MSVKIPRRFAMFALLAGLALITAHTWAQRAAPAAAPPNFDIRTETAAGAAAYMARFASPAGSGDARAGFADARARFAGARAAGLARLQAAFQNIEVVDSPELGTPEVVGVKAGGGFLTAATADRVGAMRGFLSSYADLYGLTQDQVASLELVADYANPAGNMAWVEFEQKINGLPVFRGLVRGGFTANGELARTTGPLAAGLDAATLSTSPTLTAAQAVSQAAANVGWSVDADALVQKTSDGANVTFARGAMAPMVNEPRAWLLYFPLAPGVARLAWATEIWGDPDAFLILLDAEDGTVLFRKNLTNYQSQAATYVVYNDDSPAPLSPTTVLPGTGTQAPFIARTPFTLIGNEAPNTFNNLGWMTDGTNLTDGNNVEAGLDRVAPDGVDAPVPGSARVFDFAYNPQTDEALTVPYQNGEVTDSFYWTNVYHDRLYLLGFTEAARNFQNDNFGRGGVAADRIRAEAQDSSGINNPNFATAPDGVRGRMQMYIFPGPTPDRSSGLEHDVLLHELTHGTSNRLHNNASGLNTQMAAAMGEGWSDFYARALLSTASEDPNGIYATGGWITNVLLPGYTDNYYYGIRRFPYASISNVHINGKPYNPLTFADIDPTQLSLVNGAFPCNPLLSCTSGAPEVHNAGEIWASALMEVRARFITRLGFATGNQRILQFVTDGMKLDPVSPTFIQGRDAIVAAANAGGGSTADLIDVWTGFAARGMGFSARVVSASNFQVVEAFDLPGITAGSSSIVTESIPNGRLDPLEVVTVSLCLTNSWFSTSGSVTGTLAATGGVSSPSGPQVYGAIPPGGSACKNYTFTVGNSCGTPLTATLQAAESGGPTRNLAYNFQVGTAMPYFNQNFDAATPPALPSGWTTITLSGAANLWVTSAITPDTAPNRAFVADPAGITDNVLVSPTIAWPAGAVGASVLTFRHLFNTDTLLRRRCAGDRYRAEARSRTSSAQVGASCPAGIRAHSTASKVTPSVFARHGRGARAPTSPPPSACRRPQLDRTSSCGGAWELASRFRALAGPSTRSPSRRSRAGPMHRRRSRVISAKVTAVNTPIAVDFTVGDAESGPASVSVSASSSNTTLVPNANLALSGTGASRRLTITPSAGRSGATLITLVATDGQVPVSTAFALIVGTPPRSGDFDGDAQADITVFRPSTGVWHTMRSMTGTPTAFAWGNAADTPVIGDFDGDGRTDIAVFRPSNGTWYIVPSSTGVPYGVPWGNSADVPVPGDYDADGKTDIAVFRPSNGTWYVVPSTTGVPYGYAWGNGADIPVPGDYDGDIRTDIAVFRPSNGTWYVVPSSGAAPYGFAWGNGADIPVPGRLRRGREDGHRGVPAVERDVVRGAVDDGRAVRVCVGERRGHPGAGGLRRGCQDRHRGVPSVERRVVRRALDDGRAVRVCVGERR